MGKTQIASAQTWQPGPPPHERRRSGRVRATGTAILHGPFAAHARIVDLAVGGLTLLFDDASALPEVGTRVRLDVRLDGVGSWLHLVGTVNRRSSCALVIELLVVPLAFEDVVQGELLSALECAQKRQILLVDGVHLRREVVAVAFRATGCRVIEASSPLEAIGELGESRLHFWAAVIGDTKVPSHADELRRFLRETYPEVPLIDIGSRRRGPRTMHLTVDRIPDLASQIDSVMTMRARARGAV